MIIASRFRLHGRVAAFAGSALLAICAASASAVAAPIPWATKGAFEACLESSLEKWLAEQATLQVNEDRAAGQLDDIAAVSWTAGAVAQCRTSAGTADAASVEKFTQHMARWRQHIYDAAVEIRKQGQSD